MLSLSHLASLTWLKDLAQILSGKIGKLIYRVCGAQTQYDSLNFIFHAQRFFYRIAMAHR